LEGMKNTSVGREKKYLDGSDLPSSNVSSN
jgi:hypothetical protein